MQGRLRTPGALLEQLRDPLLEEASGPAVDELSGLVDANEHGAFRAACALDTREHMAEVDRHIAWMTRTQENLKNEEAVGTVPTGSADYYGTSIAALERDRTNLDVLVRNEYAE